MRKYYILLGILLILLIITIIYFLSEKNSQNPAIQVQIFKTTPTPSQSINSIDQELKTVIGKTDDKTILTLPNIKDSATLPNGSTQYNLTSPLKSRDDEIITKNNKVIFERVIKMGSDSLTVPQYKKILGEPERIIEGSDYYGIRATTYIFANKGVALIGDSLSDNVYEVQAFTPTTIEEYIRLWGSDIKPFTGEYPKP